MAGVEGAELHPVLDTVLFMVIFTSAHLVWRFI